MKKEGNVLFNNALNMVKWHQTYDKGKLREKERKPLHGLLFPIFYMHHPTDRIAHTTAFVIPVMEHWLECEIAQWVHHEGSICRPIAP